MNEKMGLKLPAILLYDVGCYLHKMTEHLGTMLNNYIIYIIIITHGWKNDDNVEKG